MTKRNLKTLIGVAALFSVLLLAIPLASADLYAGLPSSMPAGAGALPAPVVMQPAEPTTPDDPGLVEFILQLKPFLFGLPF